MHFLCSKFSIFLTTYPLLNANVIFEGFLGNLKVAPSVYICSLLSNTLKNAVFIQGAFSKKNLLNVNNIVWQRLVFVSSCNNGKLLSETVVQVPFLDRQCPLVNYLVLTYCFHSIIKWCQCNDSTKDRRSTSVCSLYGQLSQGWMANFPAFIASKSFDLWNHHIPQMKWHDLRHIFMY